MKQFISRIISLRIALLLASVFTSVLHLTACSGGSKADANDRSGNESAGTDTSVITVLSNYQSSAVAVPSEMLAFSIEVSRPENATLNFQWSTTLNSSIASTETERADSVLSEVNWVVPTCSNEPVTLSVVVTGAGLEAIKHVFSEITVAACTSEYIQPDIQITRTRGEVPFHVYVSSSDTSATGIEHPYDQLEYSWNFGDSLSDGRFTHPVTLNTVEANSDQTGPEASFVYRTPGTYTITLTAKYQDGDVIRVNQTSEKITVAEWSGETRYFDPVSGDDMSDGLSAISPKRSWDELSNWLKGGNNRKALIKRGTTMPVDSTLYITQSHIRIAAYGDGAEPVLKANTDIDAFIRLASDPVIEDHVYTGLHLDGNNGTADSLIYARIFEPNTSLSNIAFLDMVFVNDDPHGAEDTTSNMITIQNPPAGYIDDVLVWNSSFIRNHSVKNGIYVEMQGHFSVFGSSFSGGDGNNIKDHPIYPATVSHALYRWIDFQATHSNNFSINSASKGGNTLFYTLVDGCNITGGQNGLDFTRHNDDTTGWFSDVIIQNSAIHDLGTPAQGYGIIGGSLERATIRNNHFYGNPQNDLLVEKDVDHDVSLQLYGNKFWKGVAPADTLQMIDLKNIKYLTMDGNSFVNEGVSGGSTNIGSFIAPENHSWMVDRNIYWAPALLTPFKFPGIDYYSFAEWQLLGYDLNGKYEDPGFEDPANGAF